MTKAYEDFARKNLDVRHVAHPEWACICPFHSDGSPSMSVNVDRGLFVCYGCGVAGNFVRLAELLGKKSTGLEELEPADLQDRVTKLRARARVIDKEQTISESSLDRFRQQGLGSVYNRSLSSSSQKSKNIHGRVTTTSEVPITNSSTKILKSFVDEHEEEYETAVKTSRHTRNNIPVSRSSLTHNFSKYWIKRGFTENTISTFDLGVDEVSAEAVIPYRNADGDLLGVIRRKINWTSGPKYKYPKGFQKKNNLFASWLVAQNPDNTVVLTEGAVDCMKVWQAGYPAAAIYGSMLGPNQVRLLHRLGIEQVILAFDNDDAGDIAVRKAIPLLRGIDVKVVGWTDSIPTEVRRGADVDSIPADYVRALVDGARRVRFLGL